MRIVIESTGMLTSIDGVPVRYWEGTTEDGVACKVFVHIVAVREEADRSRFEAELAEKLPPGFAVPLRMIL